MALVSKVKVLSLGGGELKTVIKVKKAPIGIGH